jgi:1-deoxy-D-xylulose-5-phosphate reductoisomerase
MLLSNSDQPRTISLFGATGSIGNSTLDLIRQHKEKFQIKVLTAHKNLDELVKLSIEFLPEIICISDENFYTQLKERISNPHIKIVAGEEGLLECASLDCDLHIAAIAGFAGLKPLLKGLEHCQMMGIANKEPIVAAGKFVLDKARKNNVQILPIDSEHNAIFQVFETHNYSAVKNLYITASGGAFRDLTLEECETKTPSDALRHPNWSMGQKITIDSATMMNKALEVIEAHELFNIPFENIKVLLHPQSLIHSMVEYNDGSVLSQMGSADMRTPIAYMLGYPNRIKTSGSILDFSNPIHFDLSPLDNDRFPAVNLAVNAANEGLSSRILLNAANEILVEEFLNRQIAFGRIVPYLFDILEKYQQKSVETLQDVYEIDRISRIFTLEFLKQQKG